LDLNEDSSYLFFDFYLDGNFDFDRERAKLDLENVYSVLSLKGVAAIV
jgi:hypothetical protein